MSSRHLALTVSRALFALAPLAAAGCGTPVSEPEVKARLRNSLPPSCTAEMRAACPAEEVAACPPGQEPVIDYSADCCGHFTCQPLCSAASPRECPMTPAPDCRAANTKLWIGTAIEDCCPAYRCQDDGSGCDPTRETCGCDATNARCTQAPPYCGDGVMPITVGQTRDCCPIYQCPCDRATMSAGVTVPPELIARCGCTYPNCKEGEELVCAGTGNCGAPCECRPLPGICKDDTQCGAGQRCDLSTCRPPTAGATDSGSSAVPARAVCDPARCGAVDLPAVRCPDGTASGPTGRCLQNADGTCSPEVIACPPTGCYGVCVPNMPQTGCSASSDCPMGQICEVQCREWQCVPGGTGGGVTPTPAPTPTPTPTTGTGTGTGTDPATGTTTMSLVAPPGGGVGCGCDLSDMSCSCDASGACRGRTCVGKCVPPTPTCDPAREPGRIVACPAIAQVCPNGLQPIQTGTDPTTCCPVYSCPVCARSTMAGAAPTACPAIECRCAKQTGTDPMSCCPIYECGRVAADGTCG